jgi:hypothetical protein
MQSQTFNFHADPGHGWLEVPAALVRELGIAAQISAYSYISQDGRTAYLEEDCDAYKFVQAARAAGINPQPNHLHSNRDSFIRNLPRWVQPKPAALGTRV